MPFYQASDTVEVLDVCFFADNSPSMGEFV